MSTDSLGPDTDGPSVAGANSVPATEDRPNGNISSMFAKLGSGLLAPRFTASHTQTAQFRTVLQFNPSYPPSPLPPATPFQPNSILAEQGPSTSSNGGHSSDSKSNRFYEGYTGPGRAVTQANAFITSYDGANLSTEELEELDGVHRSKDTVAAHAIARSVKKHQQDRRLQRRNSMALGFIGPDRLDRAHSLGIFSAVKSHVRDQQVFNATERPLPVSQPLTRDSGKTSTSPTSSVDVHRLAPTVSTTHAQTPVSTVLPSSLLRPPDLAPVSVSWSGEKKNTREAVELLEWSAALQTAVEARDSLTIVGMAEALLAHNSDNPSPSYHEQSEQILHGLLASRNAGDPVTVGLRLYNVMVSRGIVPSQQVYHYTISLLCARDEDVRKAVARAETLRKRDPTAPAATEERIALLKGENNFLSALSLFDAASSNLGYKFNTDTCNLLLGCAASGNIDAALRVVAHLDGSAGSLPDVHTFTKLIRVYQAVGDVQGAEAVFKEFRKEALQRPSLAKVDEPSSTFPWHAMIRLYFSAGRPEEALTLLVEMLSVEEQPLEQRTVPAPTQLTYSTMITGFCDMGDLPSACAWFDRLLTADEATTTTLSEDESDVETMSQSSATSASSFGPLPPNKSAWTALLTALHKHNDLASFTKYYALLDSRRTKRQISGWPLPFLPSFIDLTRREINTLPPTDARITPILQSLSDALLSDSIKDRQNLQPLVTETFDMLATNGRLSIALATLQSIYHPSAVVPVAPAHLIQTLGTGLVRAAELERSEDLSMRLLLDVIRVSSDAGIDLLANAAVSAQLVATYRREGLEAVRSSVTDPKEWEMLTKVFASFYSMGKADEDVARQYQAFVTGLGEVLSKTPMEADVQESLASVIGESLEDSRDIFSEEELVAMLLPFGHDAVARYSPRLSSAESVFDSEPELSAESSSVSMVPSIMSSPTLDATRIRIGESITRFLEDFCSPEYRGVSPIDSYTRVLTEMDHGLYASPVALAKYIPALAKHNMYDQAKHIYTSSHAVLEAIGYDQAFQARSWFLVEDGMMTATATAGDVISSNVHRQRIIEQGGAPSAASYAALIIASKSMTDDATAASTLFAESQALGVKANTYLFNVVISALSRARRAEEALALFEQMKMEGVRWSSVTYGALIGACTRIGDELTARRLFDEMLAHSTLKPRVPPFNTMIQMYVQIKPDREQALHYYQMMTRRRIRPTAHTYKLLMDCWGTIEPVNLVEMERVFRQLENDRDVAVGGPHFASLINAYGCVAKDLDKAVATFESIAKKPYVLRAPATAVRLPDPVCYEAIINVFVSHRRSDLIRQYLERLKVTHVHMTAYVANLVIKGMAQCGDMDGARAMFESLDDPPSGLAGHVRHAHHGEGEAEAEVFVSGDGPVYREPSTWEAMVRAELGAGERDRAQELLRRMESRYYPELVLQRVRGLVYPIEEYAMNFT